MNPSDVVLAWLDGETTAVLRVTGLSLSQSRQLLQPREPLLTVEAPTGLFAEVSHGFRGFVETVIDRLTRIGELSVDYELQSLLDHGLYNPHLGKLFEKLWNARFEQAEGRNAEPLRRDLLKESFAGSAALQCDALLFWLALFGQNYAVLPGMLTLITPEPVDADLQLFLLMADTWQSKGSPLRVLVLTGG